MDIDQKEQLDSFEKYLDKEGLKASSRAVYVRLVKDFLSWRAQEAQGGGIGVQAYLESCRMRGNGSQALQVKLMAIRWFIRHLVQAGKLSSDLTADIQIPQTNDIRHSFSREDIKKMFACLNLEREKDLRDACFLIVGIFGGLRISQILGLKIKDVTGKEGGKIILRLSSDKTRTISGKPASILSLLFFARIAAGAWSCDPLLVSYKKDGRPRGNRQLTAGAADKLIKAICRRAGVERSTIKTDMLKNTHDEGMDFILDRDLAQKRLHELFDLGLETRTEEKNPGEREAREALFWFSIRPGNC